MTKTNQKHSILQEIAVKYIICLLITAATSLAVLCIIAKIMCAVDVPQELHTPLGTAALCVGCLVGGICLSSFIGQKGLLCGFSIGASVFALLWVILMLGGTFAFTNLAMIKALAFCAAGAIGGFFGVGLFEKSHKRH